jgi:preprotein translocase subunit YajC
MIFPSIAHAMGQTPGGDGAAGGAAGLTSLIPLVLMFAIFYFLLIRPQQKKAKKHREYLQSLGKGTYVLTGGGIYGRILEVNGEVLTVEIAPNLSIKINRSFISGPAEPAEAKIEKKEKKDNG